MNTALLKRRTVLLKKDGEVTEDYVYLSADEENDYVIAQANEVHEGRLINDMVVARKSGRNNHGSPQSG